MASAEADLCALPLPLPLEAARRVLVLAPHPDDESIGCGGLLVKLAARGVPTRVLLVSDGSGAGELPPGTAEARQQEFRAALQVLGGLESELLGLPDGALERVPDLPAQLRRAIEAFAPDWVFGPSARDPHRDHRAVAAALARVLPDCSSVQAAWSYETWTALPASHVLDIGAELPTKLAALRAHRTALVYGNYLQATEGLARYRSLLLGRADAQAAEAFERTFSRADAGLPEPALLQALPATVRDPGPVSVLIRSMDRDSLRPTLCSLAAQGVDEWEVLVLNASGRPHRPLPEGLPAELRGRVRLLEPPAALDRAAAANGLLEAAKFDALLFLDDDDELLPGHLGRLAAALRAAPAAVAAYGDVEYGRWWAGDWQPEHRFAAPFDRWRLLFENYLPIHAVLFRRLPGLRFDEGFQVFEDWDFWLQLAERGPFEHVPGVGARYVAGAAQGSGVFEQRSRNEALRQALYAKWLARLGAAEAGGLLAYVRELHQSHGQLQGELANATAGHAATRQVLQAREVELAALQQARTDLQTVLAAREQEIRNALAEQDSQRAVRAARETEIASLHAHVQALQAELIQLKALTPWQSFLAARRRAKPS